MKNQILSDEIVAAVDACSKAMKDLSPKDQHTTLQVVLMGMRDARAHDGGDLEGLDWKIQEELSANPVIDDKSE